MRRLLAKLLGFGSVRHWWRHRAARRAGIELDPSVLLGPQVDLRLGVPSRGHGSVRIGAFSDLERGALLHAYGGSIEIGEHTHIGPYTVIYGHGGVTIGSNTLIAMNCSIVSSNHSIPGRDELIRDNSDTREETRIGDDVWLGAGVRVMAGVTIGDGCVVGAGAVVTSNLEPYSVANGVPARVVRTRE